MELTLEATIENITRVTEFVNGHLEALGCSTKVQRMIDVAIDELFSNIAYYAYEEQIGMATVRIGMQQEPRAVTISFIDSGIPFDPLTHEATAPVRTLKERKSGGFGISIVKRSMDDVRYEYVDGCNVVTISKMY